MGKTCQCIPKKSGITVVPNKNGEFVSMRSVTRRHLCINYKIWNEWTEKFNFQMPFMDLIDDGLAGVEGIAFLMVILGTTRFL